MRSVTIRLAVAEDAFAVARLAALDSTFVPDGPLLIGLVDDEPWAVLALEGGAAVADPFRRSAEVVALLRERARLLRYPASEPPPRKIAWRRRTDRSGLPPASSWSSHSRLSPRSTRM
jgi:hypothetical protein